MITSARIAAIAAGASLALGVYLAPSAASRASHGSWVRVALDANYEIAIDTGSVRAVETNIWGVRYLGYAVRYRTVHTQPRLHHGESFDREVVSTVVQCDSLWFQVSSVDMLRGERKLVARQRVAPNELLDTPWRRVERGTTEEVAAQAACHFGRARPQHVDASK